MIKLPARLPFAALLVLTCFFSSYSVAALQNPSSSPTPPPPPPTNIPAVSTGNPPAATPAAAPQSGSTAAPSQPGGGQGQPQNAVAVDPARLQKAVGPIQATPAAAPQPTPKTGPDTYILDWNNGSATPDTVYDSGRSTLRITNVNDILYSYDVKVTRLNPPDNDLSQWKGLIQDTINALTQSANKAAPNTACTLSSPLGTEKELLKTIGDHIDQMQPKASGSTKCSSTPVKRTIAAWKSLREQYDQFESGLADV